MFHSVLETEREGGALSSFSIRKQGLYLVFKSGLGIDGVTFCDRVGDRIGSVFVIVDSSTPGSTRTQFQRAEQIDHSVCVIKSLQIDLNWP